MISNRYCVPRYPQISPGTLVESLAVYNLFSTITGSNNADDFTPFLAKISEERVLTAVNKIFQAGIDTSQVPVDLAMELTKYVNDQNLTGFTVTSLSDQSVSELQAAAENDIATLFSLNELIVFTISGNQPGYAGLNIDSDTFHIAGTDVDRIFDRRYAA